MPRYLRAAAIALLVSGLVICVLASALALHDEAFFKAGEALARHPEHPIFQGEYYAALIRHIAYIVTAIVGVLVGSVVSALLFGMYGVMRRLERLEATVQASAHTR